MRAERRPLRAAALALGALALLAAGCHDGPRQAMYDQAKYEVYEPSPLFDDDAAARPFPEGTVARGHFDPDRAWATGTDDAGAYVSALPERVTVDRALLRRGEQRYGIFCAPCHGALGYGDGMIVQRGYYQPASYHEARLQQMPDGYYFDVISNGFGRMPAYASQVPVDDRWAIVAYLRALQLSQNARLAALPGEVGEVARRAMRVAAEAPAEGEPIPRLDGEGGDGEGSDGQDAEPAPIGTGPRPGLEPDDDAADAADGQAPAAAADPDLDEDGE